MDKNAYFVYFIALGQEYTKIGMCNATLKNLKQRLSEAKRWCPEAFIVGLFITEDENLEKALHRYFDGIKVRSEVFYSCNWIENYSSKHCGWTGHQDIKWEDWAYYWETYKLAELEVEKLKEIGEVYEDESLNEFGAVDEYECKIYNEEKEDWEEVDDIFVIIDTIWKEKYSHLFNTEYNFEAGDWGLTVQKILLKIEGEYLQLNSYGNEIDDNFTGLYDDGFYYVNGELCIEDVFGIYQD